MTFKKLFFLPLLTLSLYSCKFDKHSSHENIKVNLTKIDSIKIDIPNAIITDVRGDNILLYNMVSNDIAIYNIKEKYTKKFNKYGTGPDEFVSLLQPYTLKFFNDSLLGVASVNKLKVYNFNGKLKKSIKVKNEGAYAPLSNFKVLDDSILVALKKPQGNHTTKDFYSQKHKLITTINLNSNLQSDFGVFPFEKSDLNLSTKNYYYPYPFIYFSQLRDNEYSIINSNDANIFVFDLKTNTLKRNIKLDLDNYNPLKKEFNQKNVLNADQKTAMIEFYTNSTILGYFKYFNNDFILYSEAYDNYEIVEYFKNNKIESSDFTPPKLKVWLHTLQDGEKKSHDILIKSSLGVPVHIFSKDRILFRKPLTEDNELNGSTSYYICKL